MVDECYMFETAVVDGEMPFDRQHEDREIYDVIAVNEAHVKLAVKLLLGDRYNVSEVTQQWDVDSEDPREEFETDISGYSTATINAFEVVDEVTSVRTRFYADDEWHKETKNGFASAVRWYRNHDLSNPDADHPDKTTGVYEAATDVAVDSFLQSLPESTVNDYIAATTDITP